ncbi:hypothetical protein [Streptomyces sp. NPDC000410]|uniref:hypothetical protein n=1 Tax=Streptomyces sp. NPDC000410 TaxID=3154254 RepID=UPI00331ACEE7
MTTKQQERQEHEQQATPVECTAEATEHALATAAETIGEEPPCGCPQHRRQQ